MRGFRIVHPHADRMAGMMKRLSEHLESQLSAYSGAWLENKRLGLTVHYRQLPGQLLGSLQSVVAEAARNFAGELRIVQGPKAWEITPAKGWSKGTAVRLILADFGASSDVLFYAGDGANDADPSIIYDGAFYHCWFCHAYSIWYSKSANGISGWSRQINSLSGASEIPY